MASVALSPHASLDDIFSYLDALNNVARGTNVAERLAYGMVTAVAKVNCNIMATGGEEIHTGQGESTNSCCERCRPVGVAMRGFVEANARLIRSIPQDLAQDIAQQIATRQMRGERADVIAADLRTRMPEITKAKAQLIARTNVAMTATAISQARAENLNMRLVSLGHVRRRASTPVASQDGQGAVCNGTTHPAQRR